jgi:hypothetical protein
MITPDLPDDITELAAYYVEHIEQIRAWDSALWHAKRRLMEVVKDSGPIVTAAGRLGIEPTGYDYDDEAAAAIMPALVTSASVTFTGTQPEIERALSLVLEEIPAVEFSVKHIVDRKEMLRVIRMKGDAATLLDDCRTPRGRLGVS